MSKPYEELVPIILTLLRPPHRLSTQQTADVLQFRDKDAIGILVAARMLKPLGSPPKGAPLWFSTSVILKLADNTAWLDKATRIVREHVKEKNENSHARS